MNTIYSQYLHCVNLCEAKRSGINKLMNDFVNAAKTLHTHDRQVDFKYRSIAKIPLKWKLYTDYGNDKLKKCKAHECYNNAWSLAKSDSSYKLVAGMYIAISALESILNQIDSNSDLNHNFSMGVGAHGFNLNDKSQIIDVTLDTNEYIYFGEVVDHNKFATAESFAKYIENKFNTGTPVHKLKF